MPCNARRTSEDELANLMSLSIISYGAHGTLTRSKKQATLQGLHLGFSLLFPYRPTRCTCSASMAAQNLAAVRRTRWRGVTTDPGRLSAIAETAAPDSSDAPKDRWCCGLITFCLPLLVQTGEVSPRMAAYDGDLLTGSSKRQAARPVAVSDKLRSWNVACASTTGTRSRIWG